MEVQIPTPGLQNLIKNPDGEHGAWGWETPVFDTVISGTNEGSQYALTIGNGSARPAHFTTELMPVTAGQYVVARFNMLYGGTNVNLRPRIEFYNNKKEIFSNSPQGAAAVTGGTSFVPAFQAPAGTAFIKLRLDMYNGTGSPLVGDWISFNRVMVATAATNTGFGSIRTNLIRNPSFEVNSQGWYDRYGDSGTFQQITGGAPYTGTGQLRVTIGNKWTLSGANVCDIVTDTSTGGFPVYASTAYTLSAAIKPIDTANARVDFLVYWFDWQGTLVATNWQPYYPGAQGQWNWISMGCYAPNNAVYGAASFRFHGAAGHRYDVDAVIMENTTSKPHNYFDGNTPDTATVDYGWQGTPHLSYSTAALASAGFAYQEPYAWMPITGSVSTMSTNREAMNTGLMNVTLNDGTLDPAMGANPMLKPGKQVRVRARDGAVWKNLYTGKINNAHVEYEKKKVGGTVDKTLRTNLWLDPSIQTNVSGWSWSNVWGFFSNSPSTVTHSTERAYVGDRSAKIVFGNGTTDNKSALVQKSLNVVAGRTYTVSAYVYVPSGSPNVVFRDPNKPGTATVTAKDQWVRTSFTVTYTSAESVMWVSLSTAVPATGGTAFIDAIMVEEGTTLNDYFDGSSTAVDNIRYRWSGKANDSTSVMVQKGKPVPVNTTINITAQDAMADLGNQGETRSVATIDELPFLLEGKGVPWNCNGKTSHILNANVVAYNDSASMADQVSITRDTARGYAWVDKDGVLQAWDYSTHGRRPFALNLSDVPVNSDVDYMYNGDFSTTSNMFTATASTMAVSTTAARTAGTNGLRVTTTGALPQITAANTIKVPHIGLYEVSYWSRTSAAGAVILSDGYDYATNDSPVNVMPTANTWVQKKFFTVSQDFGDDQVINFAFIFLRNTSYQAPVTGTWFDIDDITVKAIPAKSYSDINVDWDTDRIMNQVEIKHLMINAEGTTEEVLAGTYEDTASVSNFGPKKATFTIVGNSPNFTAYASNILMWNASPRIRANSVRIPIKNTDDLTTAANLEICDKVYVTFANKVSDTYRVATLRHTIDASGWFVDLTFETVYSNPAPQYTPAPPVVMPSATYVHVTGSCDYSSGPANTVSTVLPPGRWIINTSGYVDWSVNAANAYWNGIYLVVGDSMVNTLSVRYFQSSGQVPFAHTWFIHNTTPTQVYVQGAPSNMGVGVQTLKNVSLTAMDVS